MTVVPPDEDFLAVLRDAHQALDAEAASLVDLADTERPIPAVPEHARVYYDLLLGASEAIQRVRQHVGLRGKR